MIGALYEQVDQAHLLIAQIGTIVVSAAIIWSALTKIRLCRFWWVFVTVGALLTVVSVLVTYNPTPSMSATGFPFVLMASETIGDKQFGALLLPWFPLSLLANVALCFGIALGPLMFIRANTCSAESRKYEG